MHKLFLLAGVLVTSIFASQGGSRIINGTPVPDGQYTEVIKISPTEGPTCTATVIGPRAILTAAHCTADGDKVTFAIKGKTYTATMVRSPLFESKDHDLNVGITAEDIAGITPAFIGGKATVGLGITLFGYGCDQPNGANDGVLRMGDTVVTGLADFNMVSKKANGAAVCFGDSGGPAMIFDGGKHLVLGVNSKGNILDTNWDTRTDMEESQKFLNDVATSKGIKICGVNSDCGGTPDAPTCTLSEDASVVNLGSAITVTLTGKGQITNASIENNPVSVPVGKKSWVPAASGKFTAHGSVTGPGGTGTCQIDYEVKQNNPDAPTCTLTATPGEINLGDSVTLQLQTQGKATSASIEGVTVDIPTGKSVVKPTAIGNYTAHAAVTGPGGTGNCSADYTVSTGGGTTPNFAVVPAYCGLNKFLQSGVARVCIAIIKKDASVQDLKINQVILVHYRDTSKEVLPIIARKPIPLPAYDQKKEDLTLYANSSLKGSDYQILDTRNATLTKNVVGGADVPTAIEGRTATGDYFLVDQLNAFETK